jgi:hypothetical protein
LKRGVTPFIVLFIDKQKSCKVKHLGHNSIDIKKLHQLRGKNKGVNLHKNMGKLGSIVHKNYYIIYIVLLLNTNRYISYCGSNGERGVGEMRA